jgi:hypothetical protein
MKHNQVVLSVNRKVISVDEELQKSSRDAMLYYTKGLFLFDFLNGI